MFMNEVQKKSVNGAGGEAERHERSELPDRPFFYVVSGAILFLPFPVHTESLCAPSGTV